MQLGEGGNIVVGLLVTFSLLLLWGSSHNTILAINTINKDSKCEYTIATWNLGHFSKGKKPYSTIDNHSFNSNYEEFQRILNDSIKADIVCVNEYSEVFCSEESKHDKLTRDLFFSDYDYFKIGPLLGYSCNSIFCNVKLESVKLRMFEISKMVVEKMPRAENYYYLEGYLYLNNIKVKLVCAHTTSSANAVCQSQIFELLTKCRNEERVIMCGDWNTLDFSLFENSGYILSNDGSLKTFPSKGYALDNIVVKGLEISDVRMIKTDLSDHYPLVCRISLK